VFAFSGPFRKIARKPLMSNTLSRELFARQDESIPTKHLIRQGEYRADSALSDGMLTPGKKGPVDGLAAVRGGHYVPVPTGHPTDPGDAADLSIMGYLSAGSGFSSCRCLVFTFAQDLMKINSFLTKARESLGLR